MATEDWVRVDTRPSLASWQFGHAQFHWGKPPPAAVPRRRTRILSLLLPQTGVALNRFDVGRALAKDLNNLDLGLLPLFLFHNTRMLLLSYRRPRPEVPYAKELTIGQPRSQGQ